MMLPNGLAQAQRRELAELLCDSITKCQETLDFRQHTRRPLEPVLAGSYDLVSFTAILSSGMNIFFVFFLKPRKRLLVLRSNTILRKGLQGAGDYSL
jgi:hypothetical protein